MIEDRVHKLSEEDFREAMLMLSLGDEILETSGNMVYGIKKTRAKVITQPEIEHYFEDKEGRPFSVDFWDIEQYANLLCDDDYEFVSTTISFTAECTQTGQQINYLWDDVYHKAYGPHLEIVRKK
ncbi:hypothetical protein [Pseudoalteromonas phage J2-1_QLiu-2017]|nr:hypothetical protein [Pseudoalteromonas phage J2-1_QLiu-2017]